MSRWDEAVAIVDELATRTLASARDAKRIAADAPTGSSRQAAAELLCEVRRLRALVIKSGGPIRWCMILAARFLIALNDVLTRGARGK